MCDDFQAMSADNGSHHDADQSGLLRRRNLLIAGVGLALGGCTSRKTAAQGVRYRVHEGDTIELVAWISGLEPERIRSYNRLGDDRLTPGQVLLLPGVYSLRSRALYQPPQAKPTFHEPAGALAGLQMVSRREWGSMPMRSNYDMMDRIDKITVHHTGEIPGMIGRPDPELMQAMQRFHQETKGWADIGYHYLVGVDGRVYEGRPPSAQGAHVGGARNRHNLGISVIGDFQQHRPAAQQVATLQQLLLTMQGRYAVPSTQVFGHRELGPTVCPGDHLFAWLKGYRQRPS
jgi:hypothetical protein